MDLERALNELRAERAKVIQAITVLETLHQQGSEPNPHKRGRKSMSEEERRVVSLRMRSYWAQRRQEQ